MIRMRTVTKILAKEVIPPDTYCNSEYQNSDYTISEKDEQGKHKQKNTTPVRICFKKEGVIGSGTFGLVQMVQLLKVAKLDTDQDGEEKLVKMKLRLAMKTVLAKYKESRELSILRSIDHRYLVKLRYFFFSKGPEDRTLLNLLFDPQPTSVYQEIVRLEAEGLNLSREELVDYALCLCEGLQYLHDRSIAHRDIKPRNLLVNPKQGLLQICDLGSACHTDRGEPLTPYICSRFYRAPELLLSSTQYSCQVDMWSVGCVLTEMASLSTLFTGVDTGEMLSDIVDILGVPTTTDLEALKGGDVLLIDSLRLLQGGILPLDGLIKEQLKACCGGSYPGLADLCCKLLLYNPEERLTSSSIQQETFFKVK